MLLLKVSYIEPLVMSRVRISTPDMISGHSVLEIPLPSTILGALGNLLGIKLKTPDHLYGLAGLYNEIVSKLKCEQDKPLLKGPLLLHDGQYYIPIYGKETSFFIPVDNLDKISERLEKNNLPFVINEELEKYIIHIPDERVGVKLKRGYSDLEKTIDLGYMYRYSISTYMLIDNKGNEKVVKPCFTYILNCSEDIELSEYVRLGGRGRISRFELSRINGFEEEKLDKVKSVKELGIGDKAILLSPLLITVNNKDNIYYEDLNKAIKIQSLVIRLRRSDEKYVKLREIASDKRIISLGLGFSEAFNKRRPLLAAIPHGTLIEVVSKNFSKIENELLNLGYGSAIKL